MEVIIILIPLALFMAGLFIAGFIWMTKKGQYDDLETPGMRMLLDDQKKQLIQLSITRKENECDENRFN